jgi:biopolymer transport protein ExbB/TolQ
LLELVDIIIKGGLVMVPLFACSIVALTVVIERFLFWRRITDRRKSEEMLSLIEQDELSRAS